MSTTAPRCLFSYDNPHPGIAIRMNEYWSDWSVRYTVAGVEDPLLRGRWTVENGKLLMGSRTPHMSGRPKFTSVSGRIQAAYEAYIASLVVED